jgi:hypothetical protein
MALLAEEIVEEWLNRNGYFTIRGIKLGVQEIDLLAIRINDSKIEARHIEVQASVRPISYLCQLPKEAQLKSGRKPMSMKTRTHKEMVDGVREWINKKYEHESKKRLRKALFSGDWKYELVIHKVKFPEELDLIRKHDITIHDLNEITASLAKKDTIIQSAGGSDLLELVMLGREESQFGEQK